MITTGSKFYLGLGFLLYLGAIIYGWTSGGVDWDLYPSHLGELGFALLGSVTLGYKGSVGDHVGYTILIGASVISLVIGATMVVFQDNNSWMLARVAATDEAPVARLPGTPNYWGPLAGFGVGATALGLVISPWLFGAGIVVLVLVGLEWMMSAWADRATGDPEANRALRNQLMGPMEVPVIAALVVAFVAISFSRVLLSLPKLGSTYIAIIVASVILLVAVVLARMPRITPNLVTGVLLIGAVLVLAGGVIGAAVGEREIEEHHGEETEEHSDEEGTESEQDEGGLAPLGG